MRGKFGADLFGRIKRSPTNRRNSQGTVRKDANTPKKGGVVVKKKAKVFEIKPSTKRVPYFSS